MSIVVSNFGDSDQGIKASQAHFPVGGKLMAPPCTSPFGKVLLVKPATDSKGDSQFEFLRHSPVEVVGQVGESLAAVVTVKEAAPDVVLFDVTHFGIALAKTIVSLRDSTKLVAMMSSRDCELFGPLFQAGVCGFAMHDIDNERLLGGIGAVMNGDLWFDARLRPLLGSFFAPQHASMISSHESATCMANPAQIASNGAESTASPLVVARQFLEGANGNGNGNVPSSIRNQPLSARELEVLRLIARGATNNDIAKHLYLSVSTVKTVISRILDKLQVEDRVQAAVYATRHEIV